MEARYMSEMSVIETGTPEESRELELALEIWQQLDRAYPDHPWQVSFSGRALIVRHALINAEAAQKLGREGFGYTMPANMLNHDCAKSAVQAGGAMLELFGLKRGRWDGTEPKAPADWKHKQAENFA
jgi:hypothetical protein